MGMMDRKIIILRKGESTLGEILIINNSGIAEKNRNRIKGVTMPSA